MSNCIGYKGFNIGRRDLYESINYYNAYWSLEFVKFVIDKNIAKNKERQNKGLSRTFDCKLNHFNIYIYERVEDITFLKITEKDLENYAYYLRDEVGLSDIVRYMREIKRFYDFLIYRGEIIENPANKVMDIMNKMAKKRGSLRSNFINQEQMCKAKKELPDYLKLYMCFSLTSGAESNQIRTLKWEDIDFDKRIAYAFDGKVLYFSQEVLEMLVNERNRRIEKELNDCGYVFRSHMEGKYKKTTPISKSTIGNWCTQIGEIIGIKNLCHRDFRHTAMKLFLSATGSVGMTSIIMNYPYLTVNAKYFVDEKGKDELLQEYKNICEI